MVGEQYHLSGEVQDKLLGPQVTYREVGKLLKCYHHQITRHCSDPPKKFDVLLGFVLYFIPISTRKSNLYKF